MSEDAPAAAIGEGRARPPFEPKSLQCPECGSPLTIHDERSVLVLCPACDSEVQLTVGEAKVLGKREGSAPNFKLELGQSFVWEGHRYEVTGRMAYTASDDDWDDPPTYMYLLFSPRRRCMWLSSYRGRWDLSWASHIAPTSMPFNESSVQTFDGRTWDVNETDLATLTWVDGAVPWVARVGDQWVYSECSDDDGHTYEVQRNANQLEFSEGLRLKTSEYFEAVGMADRAAQARKREHRHRPVGVLPRILVAVAALFAVGFNFLCCCGAFVSGEPVFEASYTPTEFADSGGEIITEPFALQGGLAQVELEANQLSDAWVTVDVALIMGDGDTIIHIDDMDAEYYSGYEGGESWSEGSTTDSRTWAVPEAGDYQLLLRARGNRGLSETPTDYAPAPITIRVEDGLMAWWWPMLGFFGSCIAGFFAFALVLFAPWSDR